jgi:hypothetical protein
MHTLGLAGPTLSSALLWLLLFLLLSLLLLLLPPLLAGVACCGDPSCPCVYHPHRQIHHVVFIYQTKSYPSGME